MQILLIGPLPPPIGGTTLLFAQLVAELKRDDALETIVIDISRGNYHISLISYIRTGLRVLVQILKAVKIADVVSFHCSVAGAILFSPIIHMICKAYRKPWIFRKFGGVFDRSYEKLPTGAKVIINHTALSANLCLFETQRMTEFFTPFCKHVAEWYPNSRPLIEGSLPATKGIKCKRFVFCSHVTPTKGILEIISAGERMDSDVAIDVYGPFRDGMTEKQFCGLNKVHYCGVLQHKEVIATLKNYDALLLPTYHDGEGYPGILLEAYSCGIPVIATRFGSIPEIVDDTSGILIEPKNANQLFDAMQQLVADDHLYQSLCRGTTAKRNRFSSQFWTKIFVEHCKELAPNLS